jgi:hypothetical protein
VRPGSPDAAFSISPLVNPAVTAGPSAIIHRLCTRQHVLGALEEIALQNYFYRFR